MNSSTSAVKVTGFISGKITRKKILSCPAPSIMAASSRLVGICRTKLVKISTMNGIWVATSERIRPAWVL